MSTYFLCDPLSVLPDASGESALKILIQIPEFRDTSIENVRFAVLEAVLFKFKRDFFAPCSRKPFPIVERRDVKPLLRPEDWTASNGGRAWFVNDADDHDEYFDAH
jgi:hypothetical protein